ncbi:MAG TPA: hypothetical protein VIT22_14045 [Pseudoxanthomonas sp.]
MADNEKKPVIHVLPAVLTGAAALIAALTTVYINVRNDLKSDDVPPAVVASAKPAKQEPAKPAQPQELRLQLRRVAVQQDGGVGDADWRFAIEADGQPLFAFEKESMTSEGGRNIVVVSEDRDAHATLELMPGKRIPVTIKGWRSGWFKKSDPVVLGEGVLAGSGPLAPIVVKAADEGKGAFTFYFSATPEAK